MSEGKKNDKKKPRVDLIPVEFIIGTAKPLGHGATKYGEDNFRAGIQYRRLLGGIKRHIELELAGIKVDKDSGCEHWQNAAAGLAIYAYMKTHRPEFDDRYKYTEEELKTIERMMYETDEEV